MPAIAWSMSAASRVLRVIGPTWSSDSASARTPKRLTRPQVGLSPTMPLAADGKRIDPPVSLPSDPKQSPAAVATPEPLDGGTGEAVGPPGVAGHLEVGVVATPSPPRSC